VRHEATGHGGGQPEVKRRIAGPQLVQIMHLVAYR
jgi:hypothetical protein